MCDESATLELRVKTVEYFKGLERTKEQWVQKRKESVGNEDMAKRARN